MPEPQILMSGVVFGETPRWHDGRLWFSDWGARQVVAVDLQGNSEVILSMPGYMPFCFDWLPTGPDGSRPLLVLSGDDRRLLRREPDGSLVAYADLGGFSSHSWNELVVDGRGNAYANNIGFDFPEGEFAPGTIALASPNGSVRQVADGIAFPNGMVVTPDNSTLIVAESYAGRLTAFDIAADGSLSNRRVWAAIEGSAPDGICLDAEGAVWYADVPNKLCARVREGGEVLQTIDLDRGCFACMLGGPNGRMLFMIAAEWGDFESTAEPAPTGQVLTVEAPAPRAGWP